MGFMQNCPLTELLSKYIAILCSFIHTLHRVFLDTAGGVFVPPQEMPSSPTREQTLLPTFLKACSVEGLSVVSPQVALSHGSTFRNLE